MAFINNFVGLFVESAPYLLLGMLIAGAINQMLPRPWVEKTLGNKNSVVTAALIGAPLPLCSCSVIPVAMGIRRSGASKASTASFLVATPETGVDSIGITYALMGPVMAIVRPIVAVMSAIITGMAISSLAKENPPSHHTTRCNSCCGAVQDVKEQGVVKRLFQSIRYGFGKLLADFVLWLLIGLTFAALIQTYVPETFFSAFGHGVFAMLTIVALSIPMYVCATASTPIAAGLMLAGMSPGAALVFMLTGPATNIATLMVIKNELGNKELCIYLLSISLCAILSGLALNALLLSFEAELLIQHGSHSDMQNIIYTGSAYLLAVLIAWQLLKKAKVKLHSSRRLAAD